MSDQLRPPFERPIALPFNPKDWYWVVAGSDTHVFSSARGAYVAVADAIYVAWLATGRKPTKIISEAELWQVLSSQFPAGLPAANAEAQGVLKDLEIGKADVVMMRIAFSHENRLRALEGKAAITQAQFVAAVKALL